MTLEDIHRYAEDLQLEGSVILENPDFASAFIGHDEQGRLVYDFGLMVEHLMQTENMTEDEALDFIDYNTLRALPYMGELAPVILHRMELAGYGG